jgi:arylsulfatase A-like enzyme
MTFKEYWRKTFRLVLFGVLVSLCFTVFYYLFSLAVPGGSIHPQTLGNNGFTLAAFIIGAATLIPLVGAVCALAIGALVTGLSAIFSKVDDEIWERIGLTVVAACNAVVLALPTYAFMYGSAKTWIILGAGLIIGAGLLLLAWKKERIEKPARRVAGALVGLLLLTYLGFFYLGLGRMAYSEPAEEAPGPNILVIIADAQRADWASVYGGPAPTPNLERLAERGVCFERCYSPCNWTLPSVSSLFTGMEPAVHQVSWTAPQAGLPTLQGQLRERGYTTWGLFCNDNITQWSGHYQGFNDYVNYKYYSTANLGSMDVLGAIHCNLHDIFYMRIIGRLSLSVAELNLQHLKRVPNELAIELAGELPPAGGVFAYVHLFDPHEPYAPPARFIPPNDYEGPYEAGTSIFTSHGTQWCSAEVTAEEQEQIRRLYRGEISYEDWVLGRMLDELERSGAAANTVVFYSADHGEAFWEHGCLGHSSSTYNEQIHVPLVVYWPGRLEGGLRRADPVSLSDIYPTVLEGLGVDYERRATLAHPLWEEPAGERLVYAHKLGYHSAVISGEATLILGLNNGVERLYLAEDQAQLNEVGDTYPALRDSLRRAWKDYLERCTELGLRYNPHYHTADTELEQAQLERLRSIGYLQ